MARQTRRHFLQLMAWIGIGSQAWRSGVAHAMHHGAVVAPTAVTPAMTYRTLGGTGFKASRLVFGCGSALSRGQAAGLLEPAFEAGINVFDVGFRGFYKDAEKNLAPFLKKRRQDIFLISKAKVGGNLTPSDTLTVAQAREAAQTWSAHLDNSLSELQVDHVDAYYLMAVNNAALVGSEEVYNAFATARQAGKASYFGISTHENAAALLEVAIETGWYTLAQIAITPAGWYDRPSRRMLAGTPSMRDLQPALARARDAGIGLIGMKAGRYLAGGRLTRSKPRAYDHLYNDKMMTANLTAFQRSYAFVLAHGLDAVNADMQYAAHLQENIVAAATSDTYFT
jgi:aryl-alcohol dehydrogenase-like predicted oxidoreductase